MKRRDDLVLLRSLAREAYGRLGGCPLRDWIDQEASDPTGRLAVLGRIVASVWPLLGVRPPARQWEEISSEKAQTFTFQPENHSLLGSSGKVEYIALCVWTADAENILGRVMAMRDQVPSKLIQSDALKPQHD